MLASSKILTLMLVLLSTTSCSDEEQTAYPGGNPDWARGQKIHAAYCVACHNNDPSKDGSIGPALSDSSEDLIRARILHGSYPPGYQPKRATKIMPAFPFLESEVPYIAAYLGTRSAHQD